MTRIKKTRAKTPLPPPNIPKPGFLARHKKKLIAATVAATLLGLALYKKSQSKNNSKNHNVLRKTTISKVESRNNKPRLLLMAPPQPIPKKQVNNNNGTEIFYADPHNKRLSEQYNQYRKNLKNNADRMRNVHERAMFSRNYLGKPNLAYEYGGENMSSFPYNNALKKQMKFEKIAKQQYFH